MRHIKDAEEEFLFREGDEVPTFRSTYNLYNYQNLDKIEKYIDQVNTNVANENGPFAHL